VSEDILEEITTTWDKSPGSSHLTKGRMSLFSVVLCKRPLTQENAHSNNGRKEDHISFLSCTRSVMCLSQKKPTKPYCFH